MSGLVNRVSTVVLALLLVSATSAHADENARGNPFLEDGESLAQGYAIELGMVANFGQSEFSSVDDGITPAAHGFVLKDRNGTTARVIMSTIIILGAAFAASQPKSVHSKTTREGDWLVTKTTTTYRSPAEQQAIMAGASGAASGLFMTPMAEFELEVFGKNRFGFGDSTGYKMNMLFGGGDPAFYMEAGLGWGDVDSVVQVDGRDVELDHAYFGMPLRVGGALSKLHWSATLEWNWIAKKKSERRFEMQQSGNMGAKVGYHPFRLDAQMAVFGRIYAKAGVVIPQISQAKRFEYGYQTSLGFRF